MGFASLKFAKVTKKKCLGAMTLWAQEKNLENLNLAIGGSVV